MGNRQSNKPSVFSQWLGLVLLLLGAVILLTLFLDVLEILREQRYCTEKVWAEIVAVDTGEVIAWGEDGREKTEGYFPTYRYTIGDYTYQTKSEHGRLRKASIGDAVRIRYNPDNPSDISDKTGLIPKVIGMIICIKCLYELMETGYKIRKKGILLAAEEKQEKEEGVRNTHMGQMAQGNNRSSNILQTNNKRNISRQVVYMSPWPSMSELGQGAPVNLNSRGILIHPIYGKRKSINDPVGYTYEIESQIMRCPVCGHQITNPKSRCRYCNSKIMG